jgi:hypothetical protein
VCYIIQANKNFIEIIAHFFRFAMSTMSFFSYKTHQLHENTYMIGVGNALQIAQKIGTCPNDNHCHDNL